MVNRIRKALAERDQGFTLIELLVVVIIIGILAAIAIPVFLNQRKKAANGSLKADLKNLSSSAETYAVENPYATYYGANATPDDASVTAALGSTSAVNFRKSAGNTVQIKGSPLNGYCLRDQNSASDTGTGSWFYWDSQNGGLQSGPLSAVPTTGACASAVSGTTWYTVS